MGTLAVGGDYALLLQPSLPVSVISVPPIGPSCLDAFVACSLLAAREEDGLAEGLDADKATQLIL